MKAERDEPIRPAGPSKAKAEPRLAYEIAIGIIIGGVTLWVLETLVNMITVQLAMNQIKIHFGG
ncbi:MAG TPA: hypothetical protein IAA18_12900 [Candidatus Pseudomonas excrementavium]|nr:hypothetical protein [Candidatus Pseudomonas excrementavium]